MSKREFLMMLAVIATANCIMTCDFQTWDRDSVTMVAIAFIMWGIVLYNEFFPKK